MIDSVVQVVEDMQDAETKAQVDRMQVQQEIIEQSLHNIDMNGEKEKIQFALELAIHEVSKKNRKGQEGDEEDMDETRGSIEQRKAIKK